jgi:hypothetical protein
MTWKYVYTSVKGSSHLLNGSPCQDASLVRLWQGLNDETTLISIAADGAGSASHSKLGARLACRSLLSSIESWLSAHPLETATQEIVLGWFKQTRTLLVQIAERKNIKLRELSTTLLVSIAASNHSLFAQLGDGAIVYWDSQDYQIAFWPQNGEYQNTTYFVTDEKALEKLQYKLLEQEITEIALLTDGLQMLALEQATKRPFSPFFTPIFNQLHRETKTGHIEALHAPLRLFLGSDKINHRTDDDKTLILGTKR